MSTPALFTERDAAGAYEILAAASDSPREIAVLTDEEILGLGGRDAVDMVGSPFLDAFAGDEAAAANIALRSLIARGLVTIDGDATEPEGDSLATGEMAEKRQVQLDRTLAGLLTLRAAPLALMNMTRRVADQTTSITVYVFPQGGLLEELVTVDGYHRFSVPTREAAPARWARYIDQDQVAGTDDATLYEGPVQGLDDSSLPVAQRMADTRALTVLTTAGEGAAGHQVSIMALSDGVLAMETPEDLSETTELCELSAATLEALIDAAIPQV